MKKFLEDLKLRVQNAGVKVQEYTRHQSNAMIVGL